MKTETRIEEAWMEMEMKENIIVGSMIGALVLLVTFALLFPPSYWHGDDVPKVPKVWGPVANKPSSESQPSPKIVVPHDNKDATRTSTIGTMVRLKDKDGFYECVLDVGDQVYKLAVVAEHKLRDKIPKKFAGMVYDFVSHVGQKVKIHHLPLAKIETDTTKYQYLLVLYYEAVCNCHCPCNMTTPCDCGPSCKCPCGCGKTGKCTCV